MLFRSVSRCAAAIRPLVFAARVPLVAVARPTAIRTFTAGPVARMSQGVIDKDLEHKLQEEYQYEQDNAESIETPQFLKEFNNKGLWKMEDKPGEKEVSLTRTFGNEKYALWNLVRTH